MKDDVSTPFSGLAMLSRYADKASLQPIVLKNPRRKETRCPDEANKTYTTQTLLHLHHPSPNLISNPQHSHPIIIITPTSTTQPVSSPTPNHDITRIPPPPTTRPTSPTYHRPAETRLLDPPPHRDQTHDCELPEERLPPSRPHQSGSRTPSRHAPRALLRKKPPRSRRWK